MDYFIGIDVQTARGCPFAVLDEGAKVVEDGWVNSEEPEQAVKAFKQVVDRYPPDLNTVALAVDAPRTPLTSPREWYWNGGRWRRCGPKDQGAGRHCEVVVAAHRLANPQWTPSRPPFPAWMELGFAIFLQLGSRCRVYEVFPSASYRMLEGDDLTTITVRLGNFAPGGKDMLDAYVAAATLREFLQGRGARSEAATGWARLFCPGPYVRQSMKFCSGPHSRRPNQPQCARVTY